MTSSLDKFSINGMRKLSRISIYMHALIVEVMIAVVSAPLNDMQPQIMNDLGNLLEFFRQSFLYVLYNGTRQKFQHHFLGQCRFLIHH